VSENQEFNRVLVEAMYFGKPVIATDMRGGSVVAETGVTGILVPPRNPTGMARALASLARDEELRVRLGANARQYVLETFPYRMIAPKYAELYSRLVSERER
jgi:glycosyltransferase involved in cell wall biosynthesis